jgi:hypothetical protein
MIGWDPAKFKVVFFLIGKDCRAVLFLIWPAIDTCFRGLNGAAGFVEDVNLPGEGNTCIQK